MQGNKWVKIILEILAPRTCAGCGKSEETFCSLCAKTAYKFGASCIFCNQRNGTGRICPKEGRLTERMFWAGEYKDALKNAIWELKYKKRKELAKPLAKLIFKKFIEFYPKYKPENFTIIPIPMHEKKENERGYNQAKLLADEFGKISGIAVLNLLQKNKETLAQIETKTKEERMKNLESAFEVNKKIDPSPAWVNETIILIDDVATTGATFLHAASALKKEGFDKIICLALAHGYG